MRYYLLLVLLYLVTISAIAKTSSFSGKVKLKNGKSVSDASIVIKELNKHSFTNENGEFEFSAIPYGKYAIEIYSLEIKKQEFQIDFNANSKYKAFEVEPSSINLDEVVVSANSQKKEIETKGFAVNVIEPQKMATQSVQTNELLDRTAGVKVRQDGGMGSGVKYNINGLSGEAVKIFIDGIPSSNYGGSFSLNSIPPALIERIEIYKGVVPGHLSEDALGGAINVILKQRRKKSLTTSYSVGSFNTHQWNMAGSYRWDNGLTVDGSAFYNYSDNNYKVWGDDIYFKDYKGNITESDGRKVKRFHDAYDSFGGRMNVGFTDVKWADKFLIGVVGSKDYKEIQNGRTMLVVYGNRHSRQKSGVLTLNYEKKDLFVKGLSLKVDANHSYLRRQTIDTIGIAYDWLGPILDKDGVSYVENQSGSETGSAKTNVINREYTNVVRANARYQINPNHTFYINYLFNDFIRKSVDEYQPIGLQQLTNTRDLCKNILAFSYENLLFSEKLRTNLFYKYYEQKVISKEPELDSDTKEYIINKKHIKNDFHGYGITLSYKLLSNLYLLGSAEKALRFPNANELFGNNAADILEALDLRPEKSFNANIGVNFGPYIVGVHSFNFNTSFYYRDTEDMIRENVSPRNETSSFINLQDIETKGVDAEFSYNYKDKVNFRFNISRFDVLYNTKTDNEGRPFNNYRTQIPNEPNMKFNSNITYTQNNLFLKDSKTSIYYNVNYVNRFRRFSEIAGTSNISYVPTQYPMDMGVSYTFPKDKIVLSFDIKNIFDRQAFDNYGLQKPGRAFYGKVTYFIF